MIRLGTLFSGIGAFEHALRQLGISHKILFACDNGERELPLTYGDLFNLTNGLDEDKLYSFCEEYIGKIGVKKEFRKLETDVLFQLAHKKEMPPQTNVVVEYHKVGRKSPVKHKLALTQEQIIALTPNMTMKQREQYVKALYGNMPEHNFVKDAYFANYEITDKEWHEDIRFLDANEYAGNLDILIGGSPCQSFSTYGKKQGLEDTRGTLFYDYARIIKEVTPKVFIYENVAALKTNDKGNTWKVMLKVWQSLGYKIHSEVLNAADYNLPQLRRRIFIVGIREDICTIPFEFPHKMDLTCTSSSFLDKGNIPLRYYLGKKGFEWITTLSKNKRRSRVNQDIIGCQTANQQDNWIGDFRIEHPRPEHYADERIYIGKYDFGNGPEDAVGRKLTPRECLRLMGFSNNFKIAVDDKRAYRQSGNAIAVPVLKELTKKILPYLQ